MLDHIASSVKDMTVSKEKISEKILNHALEIIYLVTGEKYVLVKKSSPHCCIHPQSGTVPVKCDDVAVYFSMEEWDYVKGHEQQYQSIITETTPVSDEMDTPDLGVTAEDHKSPSSELADLRVEEIDYESTSGKDDSEKEEEDDNNKEKYKYELSSGCPGTSAESSFRPIVDDSYVATPLLDESEIKVEMTEEIKEDGTYESLANKTATADRLGTPHHRWHPNIWSISERKMSSPMPSKESITSLLMESDSEDEVDIFDDDSVVDPSLSCSSNDSSSDSENEYTKPRKKYKDDPLPSTSSRGKDITERESSVPALSNEQASFPVHERNIQNKPPSSSAEHLEDQKLPPMSKKPKKSPRDIVWKSKSLVVPDCQSKFLGNDQLPTHISDLETPYEFFTELFTESLIDHIVQETIRYNVQLNPGKAQEITKDDIRKYIGLCIVMSYIHVPSSRDYWRPSFGNKLVQETMSVNHFEKIRKYIHFANNEDAVLQKEPGHDSLFKIRPVVEELRKNFKKIPMEECLSIDEQICPTKARSYLKPHLPSKPRRWDYKLVVLCGVSGYSYDFEIYSSREDNPRQRLSEEPDLGASGNVVVRLSRGIPKNCNYKVYCDTYTSIDLFVHLAKQGIYTLGTVRKNRIPNSKLPSESEMNKKERGASVEMVTTVEGVDVSCVAWRDNKVVLLLSTLCGEIPITETDRLDKARKNVAIKCPNVVKHYNKHMGGVELLDGLLGRHENRMRSKKWYLRLFYHLLDVTVVNAWLLYRRVHGDKMRLADFREEVAESLCKMGHRDVANRGSPSSNTEQQIQMKRKRGFASHVPVKNVRLDNISHWPDWKPTRQRCKMPQCKSLTYVHCTKCGVALCLNKDKNCFAGFHTT